MKTELTLRIEKALSCYKITNIAGIKINVLRGRSLAFEVSTANGTGDGGRIDCVMAHEYFKDVITSNVCSWFSWKKEGLSMKPEDCRKGISDRNEVPEICPETSCIWNLRRAQGSPDILISCFEIKISKSDFKSKNGHNHIGNFNFYVIPFELLDYVKQEAPEGVGIISFKNGGLRRVRSPTFHELPAEAQKWILFNMNKRQRK